MTWIKCSKIDFGDDYNSVTSTELYTLYGLIVWYVNYVSIKLLLLKNRVLRKHIKGILTSSGESGEFSEDLDA